MCSASASSFSSGTAAARITAALLPSMVEQNALHILPQEMCPLPFQQVDLLLGEALLPSVRAGPHPLGVRDGPGQLPAFQPLPVVVAGEVHLRGLAGRVADRLSLRGDDEVARRLHLRGIRDVHGLAAGGQLLEPVVCDVLHAHISSSMTAPCRRYIQPHPVRVAFIVHGNGFRRPASSSANIRVKRSSMARSVS